MRIFISSVIQGMEEFREATAAAIRTLGHEPVMAEDFGASSSSPQVVCLEGVRQADALVLLLGERYGYAQPSGLSATHEEYREAGDRCPVLIFVKEDASVDPDQSVFLDEVQAWTSGQYTGSFVSPSGLQESVIKALHDFEISRARGHVDSSEMLDRVLALVGNHRHRSSTPYPEIGLALVGAPRQTVMRPAVMEADETETKFLQIALMGQNSLLTPREGTDTSLDGNALILRQKGLELRLTEEGSLVFMGELPPSSGHLPVVIEEDVLAMVETFIRFGAEVLSYIDGTNRLSHCAIALTLRNAQYRAWRTRKEHNMSPDSGSMPYQPSVVPVYMSPPEFPRATMNLSGEDIALDLMVKLRRQFKRG